MPKNHSYRAVVLCDRTYKHSQARQNRVQRVRDCLAIMYPVEMALLKRKAAFMKCPVCAQCGQAVRRIG